MNSLINYKILFTSAILALSLLSSFSNAAQVSIDITAVVTSVDDRNDHLNGAVNVGDEITGTYIYDTFTPDSSSSPTVGRYQHTDAAHGICLSAAGLSFRTDPSNVDFLVEIVDDHGWQPRDNYLLRSYNNVFDVTVPSGSREWQQAENHIAWQLDDPGYAAVDGTELTVMAPVLSDWQSIFGLTISSDNHDRERFFIRAEVTSAVVGSSDCAQPTQVQETRFIDMTSLGNPYGGYPVQQAVLYYDPASDAHRVTVKNMFNGYTVTNLQLAPSLVKPVGLADVDDINYNGYPALAIVYPSASGAEIVITDLMTGQDLKTLSIGDGPSAPITVQSMPDINGNGVREISVLMERANGSAYMSTVDPETEQLLMQVEI